LIRNGHLLGMWEEAFMASFKVWFHSLPRGTGGKHKPPQ